MHVRLEWKENHQRENPRKVSEMLTSPLLSAEACWKFRENNSPSPVMCLSEEAARLSAAPHLPSWLCLSDTRAGLQRVPSMAHTRWWGELEARDSSMLGPTEAAKGGAKGLNTGILLSVHDISFMSLKQAVINVLLCNMLPQNLWSTFNVLTYIPDRDSEAQRAPGHSEVRWLGLLVQYFIF